MRALFSGRAAGGRLQPFNHFGWQIHGSQLAVFLLRADGGHGACANQRVTRRDRERVFDGSARQFSDADGHLELVFESKRALVVEGSRDPRPAAGLLGGADAEACGPPERVLGFLHEPEIGAEVCDPGEIRLRELHAAAVSESRGHRAHRRRPSGSSRCGIFSSTIAPGVPAFHGGMGFLPGLYSDSIGPQTESTRALKRSPISRSVTVLRRCGYERTNSPKLKPS